ncbi:MAG: hypothetical protein M0P71_00775 [Melioribacteraceae bacterium]|nr:hypothetical protein [Melioribacteraceae bacterium]
MASETFYKIQGGVVSQVRIEEGCAFPLDELFSNLAKGFGSYSGILPFGCLLTSSMNGALCFVTQTPSKVYPVKYSRTRGDGKLFNLQISVPFVQYYFVVVEATGAIKNVYMSVTKKPVLNDDETVYTPPFLNIFDSGTGKICNGQMAVNVSLPLNVRINQYMSEFYVYNFNNDLNAKIPAGLSQDQGKYMEDWSKKTEKNPFFGVSNDVNYEYLIDDKGNPATILSRTSCILRRETNG